jgi:acetyl esterase
MLKIKWFRFGLKILTFFTWLGKLPRNVSTSDTTIPVAGGVVGARIYTPQSSPGPWPAILYFHGGGYVLGSLDSMDGACRDLCEKTEHMVISIDYRLAPENPYPTAAKDAISSLDWVIENAGKLDIDQDHIFVAGDSAGGGLAAVLALQSRTSHPGAVRGQVLIYPVTHHYSNATSSYEEFANSRALSRNMMIWFWDLYLNGTSPDQVDPELALPLAADFLEGLPPALVITAEKDPLRDEGIAYADKMMMQGVDVQQSTYPGEEHGFVGIMGPGEAHCKAVEEIREWLDRQI